MKKSNLVGIVAGALVGRIPLIGGNYPARVTEANNFFEQFPINILGARDVRKYKTPGAKNVLVHILQKHYRVFPDTTKIEDEIKRERMLALGRRFYFTIRSVQQDIFDILTYLEQEGIVDSVHVEGLVAKSLLREECGEVIGSVFDSLRKNGYLTDDLPDEKKINW